MSSTPLPKDQRPRNLARSKGLFDPELTRQALVDAFRKLDPRLMVKNPVMFVVEVGTVLVFYFTLRSAFTHSPDLGYQAAVFILLFLTLLFANFAEGLAEARGRAQAQSLRAARADLKALRLGEDGAEEVASTALRRGDRVMVKEGEFIPADGEVVEGLAVVDESAITGESAPVVREAGSDFNGVTAGTRVLTGHIVVEVTSNPGESFLDRMITLVEGANRQKTPNEIALTILLAALTAVFLIVTATLLPFSLYASQ